MVSGESTDSRRRRRTGQAAHTSARVRPVHRPRWSSPSHKEPDGRLSNSAVSILPLLLDLGRVRLDLHPLLARPHAACGQHPPADVHHAHAAHADRLHLRVVAQHRDVDADLLRGVVDGRPGRDRHRLAVDGEVHAVLPIEQLQHRQRRRHRHLAQAADRGERHRLAQVGQHVERGSRRRALPARRRAISTAFSDPTRHGTHLPHDSLRKNLVTFGGQGEQVGPLRDHDAAPRSRASSPPSPVRRSRASRRPCRPAGSWTMRRPARTRAASSHPSPRPPVRSVRGRSCRAAPRTRPASSTCPETAMNLKPGAAVLALRLPPLCRRSRGWPGCGRTSRRC